MYTSPRSVKSIDRNHRQLSLAAGAISSGQLCYLNIRVKVSLFLSRDLKADRATRPTFDDTVSR